MSAHPWMPFYVAEFVADTLHLGPAEAGAYLFLILHYWQHRGLPNSDDQLARIARMTLDEWSRVRPTIRGLFSNDAWTHKRVEEELAKADDLASKRSAAGKAGVEAKRQQSVSEGKANAPPLPVQSHLQSPRDIKSSLWEERQRGSTAEQIAGSAKANGRGVFVIEGSEPWKAWRAFREQTEGFKTMPTTVGEVQGRQKKGWYFPSLYPPNAPSPEPRQ